MKGKRLMTGLLAALFTAGFLLGGLPVAMAGTGQETFGNLTHYNAIVFGELETYSADIEGALAVGGHAGLGTSGSYDIGGAHEDHYAPSTQIGIYRNPNGYPTLLLGDEFTLGNPANPWGSIGVFGGPAVLKQSLTQYYLEHHKYFDDSTTVQFAGDAIVDAFFVEAYAAATAAGDVWAAANTQAESYIAYSYQSMLLHTTDIAAFEANNVVNIGGKRVLVVNYTNTGSVTISEPMMPSTFGDYDLIVMNFPDVDKASFSGGSLTVDGTGINTSAVQSPEGGGPTDWPRLKQYAERVVWNFPSASEVVIQSCGVVGSILAPDADLTANGGSVNGMMIVNSLFTLNGMEGHAFSMGDIVFDADNGEEDGEEEGGVRLTKRDADDSEKRLSGAGFLLQHETENGWVDYSEQWFLTDGTGTLLIEGLPYGSYRLVEKQAPDGYVLDETPLHFTIDDDNGVDAPLELVFDNEAEPVDPDPQPFQLRFTKTAGGKPLDGAIFTLFEKVDGDIRELYDVTSGPDGSIVLDDLEPGNYCLCEVMPPDGYVIAPGYERIHIIVKKDTDGTLYAEVSNEETMLDEPYEIPNVPGETLENRLEIIKLDHDDGRTTLAGAVFDLYWQDETLAEDDGWRMVATGLTSNEYGQIFLDNIDPGDYMLVETKAPDGSIMDTEDETCGYHYKTYFTMPESGDGSSVFIQRDVYNLRGDAPGPDTGSLTISKADGEGAPLPGASFALYRVLEGGGRDLVEQFTMDTGSYTIDGLAPGEYYIEETEAPIGYILAAEGKNVTITAGGSAGAEFVNRPILGNAILRKINALDESPLGGAVFRLDKKGEGGWETYRNTLLVPESGELAIKDLPVGEYRLVETKAPDGYQLDEETETEFEVSPFKGDVVDIGVLVVPNLPDEPHEPEGELEVHKVDSDEPEKYLENASFALYRNYGTEAQPQYGLYQNGLETGSDGLLLLTGLPVGQYYLVETNAPSGYILDDTKHYFTVVEDTDNPGSTLPMAPLVIPNTEVRDETSDRDVDPSTTSTTTSGTGSSSSSSLAGSSSSASSSSGGSGGRGRGAGSSSSMANGNVTKLSTGTAGGKTMSKAQTADGSNVAIYIAATVASVLALTIFVLVRRRHGKRQ